MSSVLSHRPDHSARRRSGGRSRRRGLEHDYLRTDSRVGILLSGIDRMTVPLSHLAMDAAPPSPWSSCRWRSTTNATILGAVTLCDEADIAAPYALSVDCTKNGTPHVTGFRFFID